MSRHTFTVVVVLLAAAACGRAEPIPADSKIEAVTLYRGQALVTRTISLPDRQGELEIIVGGLPARIVPASLSASGADGVAIRSVRYRVEAVAREPRKEVAEIDAAIKALMAEIFANQQHTRLLEEKARYVGKLEDFSSTMTRVDLTKGALNAEALTKMTAQIFEMRTKLTEQRIALAAKTRELAEKHELLKRKRAELISKAGRTQREAMIYLGKSKPGAQTIRLQYLVGSANWSPAYNVRLANGGDTVDVEYLARVTQASGEDWSGVKLTLSTATAAMNARGPLLVPMWMQLTGGKGKSYSTNILEQQTKINTDQRANVTLWNANPKDLVGANYRLNTVAIRQQDLELNANTQAAEIGRQLLSATQEGLAVSYPLPGTMTLASRNDQQLIQISRLKLAAETYYQAAPLLSTYVYLAAEVRNDSDLPLLAGPYSSYVNGQFQGQGTLRLVARGQKATVGFGVDTQLRCRRELLKKTDKTSWGSRVQTFNYRLRLENFKGTPVRVRLMDRIPATHSDQLAISLGSMSDKISDDPVYVRDDQLRGILRWDVDLAARATGEAVRDVTYSLEMKYAKDAEVGAEAAGDLERLRVDNMDMFQTF